MSMSETVLDNNESREELNQYLTFIVNEEEYGVPILSVRGIQGWEKSTPIPNSPDYVIGIINLRGEIVPIIDMRKRFGLETIPYGAHTVVIVVKVQQDEEQKTIGLIVDAVADVHDIKAEDLRKTPDFDGGIDDEFISKLGLINEKLVIILAVDHLVDWKNMNNRAHSINGNSESNAELKHIEMT